MKAKEKYIIEVKEVPNNPNTLSVTHKATDGESIGYLLEIPKKGKEAAIEKEKQKLIKTLDKHYAKGK